MQPAIVGVKHRDTEATRGGFTACHDERWEVVTP
jgi:hypothetical protein